MKKENPDVMNLLAVAAYERRAGNPDIADILAEAAEKIRARTKEPEEIEEIVGVLKQIEETIKDKS